MAIVKQLNKKTGVTYVYESHSYRDKETKQPRAKRKLLGRLDEATGEIIPTARKKPNAVTTLEENPVATTEMESISSSSVFVERLREKDEIIKSLRSEVARLQRERERLGSELLRLAGELKQ